MPVQQPDLILSWVWYDPILNIYNAAIEPDRWLMPNAIRVLTKFDADTWGRFPCHPEIDQR